VVKERSCVDMDLPTCGLRGCGVDIKFGIRAQKGSLLSVVAEKNKKKREFTMPPRRRDRQTPDPPEEREMLRRRGRKMIDPVMEREMHDL
jgi:hypothetical protein